VSLVNDLALMLLDKPSAQPPIRLPERECCLLFSTLCFVGVVKLVQQLAQAQSLARRC